MDSQLRIFGEVAGLLGATRPGPGPLILRLRGFDSPPQFPQARSVAPGARRLAPCLASGRAFACWGLLVLARTGSGRIRGPTPLSELLCHRFIGLWGQTDLRRGARQQGSRQLLLQLPPPLGVASFRELKK